MKVEIFPGELSGNVAAPGSKSIAQRMVACALLARGESVISDYPDSDDCKAALEIAQALGAIVTQKGNVVTIKGGFPNAFLSGIRQSKNEVFCGESGLASRMFIPIAALSEQQMVISGHGSLLKRSFENFEHILPPLGVNIETNQGLLPVQVKGPIVPGEVQMDGSISSQFLTGLLIALPRAGSTSIIHVSNLKSKPYITMTLEVMEQFGVKIQHDNLEHFTIENAVYSPRELTVPGDWSGAAFLLVAGALCAEEGLHITNIDHRITQADSAVLDVLKMAGVKMEITSNGVKVFASDISAFEFDANECPDLFPPLAALAAFADGVSTIYGVKRLIHKESNRGKTLQQEFAKANIRIVLRDDEMKIYPAPVRRADINSHQDHRIAMAATILGLAGGRVTIRGAECVSKSFPTFFDLVSKLQGKVQITSAANAQN
ncbi:MAG: 3-phosphoshikimate 1-carboxyvinyltransferase [Flavobacteriales bacterium]|nr:3-phosphoshikimate 1-carboxyvinyltransferase [Flavobacteriales bacterium]